MIAKFFIQLIFSSSSQITPMLFIRKVCFRNVHTYIRDIVIVAIRMKNIKFLGLLCLSIVLLLVFMLPTHSGSATAAPENKTLMQPQGKQDMATNATNIVLVHGLWADGSSWSKVIPILRMQDIELLQCN